MTKQILNLQNKLAVMLTDQQQQQLQTLWNERVEYEKAFIPGSYRDHISKEEAWIQNASLGSFATACLKDVLRQTGDRERSRRLDSRKKIVAVGWGRGYDSQWVKEAALAGLHILWIDVSDVAMSRAWPELVRQAEEAKTLGIIVPGINVRVKEFHTALAEPESIGLDLDDVAIWYSCRTLGCMINRTVPPALEIMGQSLSSERDPRKHNRIVLINAFLEDNPEHHSHTSTLVRLGTVRRRLQKGADRKVRITSWSTYQYFTQKYRAVIAHAE